MTWKTENNFLVKEFQFANFAEGITFINKILPIAEKADHHPDILIHNYNCVKIMLQTHSENLITKKDYDLAAQIDKI
jgi:4a-hydroxytetrahydrobiopterin dehydratase